MKLSFASILVVALAADTAVASTWFGKYGKVYTSLHHQPFLIGNLAYNKWHETELERWLSDHNVPYPTPADRKDLENLVKNNWDSNVATPYHEWDTPQLNAYLKSKGHQVKKGSEANKAGLISQVKSTWTDTSESAHESYGSIKDWIFNRYASTLRESLCPRLTRCTQLDRLSTEGVP